MTRYRATIVSPKGAAPKSSVIEFESEHRAGSKLNVQDARYARTTWLRSVGMDCERC